MGSRLALIAACLAALAFSASAHAAGTRPQPLMVGAAEDAAREGGPLGADAKMSLASLAGFDTIRITSIWSPGELEVGGTELLCLQTAVGAAQLHGIRVIVSVYPYGGRTTPVTAAARAQFASYAASIPRLVPGVRYLIVGNEPNLNRFWMPQFTPGGGDAAAASYLALLAQTYDAIKAVAPGRDGDRRLGLAARRRQPARVAADPLPHRLHPRPRPRLPAERPDAAGDGLVRVPSVPRDLEAAAQLHAPALDHDLPRRLRQAAGAPRTRVRRDGAEGLDAPGDLRRVRRADDASRQTSAAIYGAETPAALDAVDEATQARYYRQALQLAACQQGVVGLLFFHVSDEPELDRWQSGVYYPDDTPKSSLAAVAAAARAARAGDLVSRCG